MKKRTPHENARTTAPIADATAADEVDEATSTFVPCPHPEHRLGTHGRLKKNQRVCLQCGDVVVVKFR